MSAFKRKYNTLLVTGTTAIRIPMIKRGVVDFAVSADWTPAAGDVKIRIDAAAAANVTNLPTAITMGNTAEWEFILTAAELSGKQITVTVADSATKAVEDQMFIIETFGNASAMYPTDLSAAVLAVNTTQVGGTAQTAGDLAALITTVDDFVDTEIANIQSRLPAALVSGRMDVSVGAIATGAIVAGSFTAGAIDAAAIATDAIDSDAIAASAVTEIQSGLSTLNAAGIRTAVGLASANLDTQLDALPTAAENADAVWDEARSGHTTSGTFGEGSNALVSGSCITGTLTTTQSTTDLTEATDDHYIGRSIVWITGALLGQASAITDYVGSTKTLTYSALTEAPANGDRFVLV